MRAVYIEIVATIVIGVWALSRLIWPIGNTAERHAPALSPPQTYCPVCGTTIELGSMTCPRCKADIDEWDEKGFVERLIGALRHPLADVRTRAIIVLGNRREKSAEQPLVDCAMAHAADIVEGIAIVSSLWRIREGEGTSWALEKLAENHPAHAVREAAKEALAELAAS